MYMHNEVLLNQYNIVCDKSVLIKNVVNRLYIVICKKTIKDYVTLHILSVSYSLLALKVCLRMYNVFMKVLKEICFLKCI